METGQTSETEKAENQEEGTVESKVEVSAEEGSSEEASSENVTDLNGNEEGDSEEACDDEKNEFKEKYYYLAAELENLKKRHSRDLEQVRKFGSENILKGLLEVMDNFDRSVEALRSDPDAETDKIKNIISGIEMVQNQFLDTLAKFGLTTVEAKGKKFDPNFHEALAQQPAEDCEDGHIITEYQRGYILNGRLLRPAKVIVAKNS